MIDERFTAAHEALDRRTKRAARQILKLQEKCGLRMDRHEYLRRVVLDELNGVADLAHELIETCGGDDVVVNDLYVRSLEPEQ